MDFFEKNELKALIKRCEGPCVPIYMPTHQILPGTKEELSIL